MRQAPASSNGNLGPATADVLRQPDGTVVVAVVGEFDMVTSPALDQALGEAVGTADGPVVVDLADCTFVDSSALGALVRAAQRLEQLGRALRIRNPRPHVRRAIDATGLERLLGLEDTAQPASR
jgi:anti-sigma B factor antagonist